VSGSLKTASLAQWIVESGRGTSILARQHLNFGGIKFRDRMVGHAQPVDYTGSDGETTVYCKFASIDAFILGYWHFIQSGPYEGWDGFQNDGPGYLRHIAAKYAGDSAYLTKVMAVYDEAKSLLGLDGQSSTTTSSSTTGVVSGGGDLKLAVVIGHNSSSKGHAGQSPIEDAEYDWNGRVAAAMAAEAGHYNITMATIRRQAGLGYTAEIAQAYEEVSAFGAHCAIELHYNGVDDASADGIEMLCRPDSAKAKAMGLALVAEVSSLLHLRIRRGDGLYLVNPGDRGAGSCYALSNVPTVLCEPFFVTNAQDRAAAAGAGEAALGRAYLRAVRAWANASS
jgi:N-acetylmuramoyl-L-alanine amidase